MRQMGKAIIMLGAVILVLAPVATAQNAAPEMSTLEAWRFLRRPIAMMQPHDHMDWHYNMARDLDQNSLRISPESIEFDVLDHQRKRPPAHYALDLKTLPVLTAKCETKQTVYQCKMYDPSGQTLGPPLSELYSQSYWWKACALCRACPPCSVEDVNYATSMFVGALGRLRAFAIYPNAPLHDFARRAAEWRALAAKPPLPEPVRVRRLMAEDAIKNRKPEEALHYYELGLDDYPTWPQGWFNAALVASELGIYDAAAEYMQNYLELVPDAPDAQAARDQMEMWKVKAKEKK